MDISSYILLSHEQALRRRLDITANNMANANTVGFRRERPVFHEYVERAEDAMVPQAKSASFVLDYRAMHDPSQGGFQATGNPLDVMIDGPGYLSVEAPGGGTAYTRAGFIKVNDAGDLVTSGGQRILDEGGRPIAIPAEAQTSLQITSDGTVTAATGPLGRIGVTVFETEEGITPRGDGMMSGTGGRVLSAAETKLKSGGVEGSNVQPIVETTELVDILRSYQSSMKMTDALNDMRTRAIQRLSKLG
jgi:flagellar basal-body rod protein FlgF